MVVPSIAVTSIWCQAALIPRSASLRAASIWKMRRITCSPSRTRALDSAGPEGVTVPGFTGRPGIANVLASTRSYPWSGNSAPAMTAIAVTSAVSARFSLCPCPACATACAIAPSASNPAIRPARRSSPSRSSQNPGPATACASRSPASAGPASSPS